MQERFLVEERLIAFYGIKDVTGLSWVQKFYLKNHEKVEKSINIQEYPKKLKYFSALLILFFQMNRSRIKYVSTKKTSKNPRNSSSL